jgi:hypothetical protein
MNPLVKNGIKVIPSVTRVFDLRHELHIYLQAYREATTTSGDVVAFASLYRAHRSAVQTPLVLVSQVQSSGLTAIPLDFTIALGNLACGKYELQVTIIDPTQKRTSFWKTTIAVVP